VQIITFHGRTIELLRNQDRKGKQLEDASSRSIPKR
jgi:hypothetical protein